MNLNFVFNHLVHSSSQMLLSLLFFFFFLLYDRSISQSDHFVIVLSLSLYLSYLSILSTYLIYLPTYLPTYLPINLSIYLSILSIYLIYLYTSFIHSRLLNNIINCFLFILFLSMDFITFTHIPINSSIVSFLSDVPVGLSRCKLYRLLPPSYNPSRHTILAICFYVNWAQ